MPFGAGRFWDGGGGGGVGGGWGMASTLRLLVLVLSRMGHCVPLRAQRNRVVTRASDTEPFTQNIVNESTVP